VNSEDEAAKLETAIVKSLEGLQVEVVAGQILHDKTTKPLTHEGAVGVLDRLRARGFKVTRA
jgi:hypothetical protein